MFTIYRQVENSRLTLFTFIKKTLFYIVEQKSFRHMLKRMSAVVKIQNLMKNKRLVPENINAYIVPSGDAHQSEYIAPCDRRRQFVSNFTGSAGTVIVTENKSALWTDGRYYLQAEEQIGDDMILMKDGLPSTPSQADWLTKELSAGGRVGVDPYLMSMETWKPLSKTLKESGCCLVPVEKNLVDQTWEDRPAPPCSPLLILSLEYTGKSWQDKVEEVQKKMADKKCGALILTALDEIAYLFNLRGADIEYNPVFMSYAVVTENDVSLYIDDKKVTKDVEDHLNVGGTGMQVTIKDYSSIGSDVSALPDNVKGKIWISVKSSYALASSIPKERRFSEPSPIALMKAKKNEVEINGMKNAHIKDAVALCEFFNWVETEIGNGTITEISAADKQEEIKREQKDFVSLSFDTISSVGAHGAIIHYKPTPKTDKVLSKDQIYLNDSGTQYKDGTTDVTRTLHFGTPTDMEKECYTRVLKGYINLCTAVFPNGVKGHMLDTLARTALWDIGLDYLHGTGHGVGAFLNVHEGPCGISSRVTLTDVPLEEGMILSDEPGYYEDGKFGIRIENLVAVVKADTKFNFKNKGFLTFEPITLVPLQIKMISPSLLSQKEIDWINEYHTTIRDVVGPEMLKQGKKKAYDWMMKETQLVG